MERDFFEKEAWEEGRFLIGVDEVGMGCIAASCFVAAVAFPLHYNFSAKLSDLRDSKKLSDTKRIALEEKILEDAWWKCVRKITPQEINDNEGKRNLYWMRYDLASQMVKDFPATRVKPICVIDGNRALSCDNTENRFLIKGDDRSYTIAAASILAKRAKTIEALHYNDLYPQYKLSKNQGYSTKEHRQAISQYGLTPIHRNAYCKNFLRNDEKLTRK